MLRELVQYKFVVLNKLMGLCCAEIQSHSHVAVYVLSICHHHHNNTAPSGPHKRHRCAICTSERVHAQPYVINSTRICRVHKSTIND